MTGWAAVPGRNVELAVCLKAHQVIAFVSVMRSEWAGRSPGNIHDC